MCVQAKEIEVQKKSVEYQSAPYLVAIFTYLGYAIAIIFGHFRDLKSSLLIKFTQQKNSKGNIDYQDWPPLYSNFESFFIRNIYRPIRDVWNRPICGLPGASVAVQERITHDYGRSFSLTGKVIESINFGSYNYLGYAENNGRCAVETEKTTREIGCGYASSVNNLGVFTKQRELEDLVCKFLGVEDALTFGMGFATNVMNIQAVAGKGDLIISDELNHASLILGSRISGAAKTTFKHNDIKDLEKVLRKSILNGQPKSHRPWKKIILIVEGIYSMEGSIVPLPEVIRLCKQYRIYLYLDEAHSIGALGPNGRGVVDYWECDPKDVDLLMGTFTKSFGSMGGYIAGSKKLIDHIRKRSYVGPYGTAFSPVACQQVITSMTSILNKEHEAISRLYRLAWNTRYFRRRLTEMGFIIYGSSDSPVIPLMLYSYAKIPAFSRLCLERGLAVVVVGYPATPLCAGRARFCMSASHSLQQLDQSLKVIDEVGDLLRIKYSKPTQSLVTENDPVFFSRYKLSSTNGHS